MSLFHGLPAEPGTVLAGFLFFTGAQIGSFFNLLAYRLPRGLSAVRPVRSFCPACRRTIRWRDNIAILGWLLLRGRCRDCHAPVPLRDLLAELGAGTLTLACFLALPWPAAAVASGLLLGLALRMALAIPRHPQSADRAGLPRGPRPGAHGRASGRSPADGNPESR